MKGATIECDYSYGMLVAKNIRIGWCEVISATQMDVMWLQIFLVVIFQDK